MAQNNEIAFGKNGWFEKKQILKTNLINGSAGPEFPSELGNIPLHAQSACQRLEFYVCRPGVPARAWNCFSAGPEFPSELGINFSTPRVPASAWDCMSPGPAFPPELGIVFPQAQNSRPSLELYFSTPRVPASAWNYFSPGPEFPPELGILSSTPRVPASAWHRTSPGPTFPPELGIVSLQARDSRPSLESYLPTSRVSGQRLELRLSKSGIPARAWG